MKWIGLFMILAMVLLILATVSWFVLHLLVVCIEGPALSHTEMMKRAEIALKETGGPDVLVKEAKVILGNVRATPHKGWRHGRLGDDSNDERSYPAIIRFCSLLSPLGDAPWVVADQSGLPAHVVIRFGSHAHYAYIWMFDPADMPLGKIEGVEHLSGAVYLAEKNE